MIDLAPAEEKKKRFPFSPPLLSRINEQKSETSLKQFADVEKLQSMLKAETVRRKIEEDNTLTFKQMYEDLLEKYQEEKAADKQRIAALEQQVARLQAELHSKDSRDKVAASF